MKSSSLLALLFVSLVFSCAPKVTKKTQEVLITEKEPPKEKMVLPEVRKDQMEKLAGPKKVIRKIPEPARVQKEAGEKYLILNFDGADIETVISTLGELLEINYILSPGISGKVTIQSYRKFPLRDLFYIFQTLLEVNGLTAVEDGPLYRIIPIDAAKEQTLQVESGKELSLVVDSSFVTQIVPLEYVKGSDAAGILKGLMPKGVDLIVYEPTNLLIVTSKPQSLVKLMKILAAIDIPPSDRENIRTFVYYVENGEAKKLAEVLKTIYISEKEEKKRTTTPRRATPRTRRRAPQPPVPMIVGSLPGEIQGDVTITAYEDINAIIIKSSPGAFLTILETLKRLDIPPKQVLIEVLIAEVTLTDGIRYGIEWLLKDFGSPDITYQRLNIGQGGLFTSGEGGLVPQALSGFSTIISGTLNKHQVEAILNFLTTESSLNVLASPHILALDNKEAKIEIGQEIPIATGLIQQPSTGADATTLVTAGQIQYRTAGTILTVTPHISEKGKVTLKISQEFSAVGNTFKVADQDFQGFITRRAETTGVVQDGHSLLIGGLISNEYKSVRSGLPFLSDLPVIGSLFSTTDNEETRTEYLLMVTPRVIGSEEEADLALKEFQDRVKTIQEQVPEIRDDDERQDDDAGNPAGRGG
jgi:type II secretory pathway component GspD/PulD (secretin)